jgi:hypothetical protein
VTTLREARDILEALAGRLPTMAPPEARHTRAALEKLAGLEDLPPRPPPENLLELLRRDLAQLFGAGRGHEATRRQLRLAPWILWNGEPRGEAITGLLEAVLAQASEHRGTLRTLLISWLLHFDPKSPNHARVGRFLAERIAASDEPRFRWARIAQAEVSLFDATNGPNRLGHVLLSGPAPLEELLDRYGFSDPMRATSAYLCHASLAALREWPNIATRKDAVALLERLLDLWTREGRLRFEHVRAAFARGLLRPWIEGLAPSEEVRVRVQRALLDRLGDPRVPGGAGRWAQVDPQAVALFKSWLARASLEAFFEIIRQFALDRQWRYRERFWKACLEKGAISDVWLALAHEVADAARIVRDLRGAFGKLSGVVDAKQAVILMRIGSLVLCEWSHNGKLRAWPADWRHAPRLGLSVYTGHQLKTESLVFPGGSREDGLRHAGSESGRWQERAAALLRERAGVALEPRDYMPRTGSRW